MDTPGNNDEPLSSDMQSNKRRRKKSIVWEYFTIETVDAGCTRACCKQCKKSFAYITGSKLAGTSHLKRHIALGICPVSRLNREKNQLVPYTAVPKTEGVSNGTEPPRKRFKATPTFARTPFDQERCNIELAKMIIMHDYPINIVEHRGFIDFVRTLQPQFNMASFDTVQGNCVGIYLRQKQSLLNLLDGIPGRVSLTLDLWTSDQSFGYVFLTGHFIDVDWKLHRRILNVIMIPSLDSEVAYNHAVAACLTDWNLDGKLFTLTLDPSFANDIVRENLRGLLSIRNPVILNGQLLIGNCYARVLSRLAQDALGSMKDAVNKVRESVKYVITSETIEEKFVELKQQLQVPSMKNLSIDNQKKWNTTYHMLTAASELKEVFSCLDTSDSNYKDTPSMDEWKQVEILCTYLKLLLDAANVLTAVTCPTSNAFFHEIWKIQHELMHASVSEDPFISTLTKPLLDTFSKYWKDTSLILAVAVVLDPRFKMKLVEFSFSRIYGEDGETWVKIVDEGVHELFIEYVVQSLPPPTFVDGGNEVVTKTELPEDGNMHSTSGTVLSTGDGLTDFDVYVSEITSNQEVKSELDQYLEESLLPRVQEFDVLGWWKLNSLKYPTLSKMASDILAIPVSTVAPDSIFDTASKKMDIYRTSLRPMTLEALLCTKDWLQYGFTEFSNAIRSVMFKLFVATIIIPYSVALELSDESNLCQPSPNCPLTLGKKMVSTVTTLHSSPPEPNLLLYFLEKCKSMDHLKQIHSQIILTGLASNPVVQSKIIAFCCIHELGCMNYARHVFDAIPEPNIFFWNRMIKGYSQINYPKCALGLYVEMLKKNVQPDHHTFPFLLRGFTNDVALQCGKLIHGQVSKFGFDSNVFVQNALINMYSLCHQVDNARSVFDISSKTDAVTWNAMISGYNRSKLFDESRKLFNTMENRGVLPTAVTLVLMLSASSKLKDLDTGRRAHQYVVSGMVDPSLSLENALIDMYAACESMDEAIVIFRSMKKRDVVSWTAIVTGFVKSGHIDLAQTYFDQMPERDSVSWTAMIDGYLHSHQFKEVLMLFRKMQIEKINPDEFTIVSVLTACAQLGALELGEWVIAYVDKHQIKNDIHVQNASIDMYFKCGNVEKAMRVFKKMARKDKFTWTGMIFGLAINGQGKEAINMLSNMLSASVRPDEVTFVGVLSACAHNGMVEEGRKFFSDMTTEHGIEPNEMHYGCMVDLLGRAGLIREAYELIKNMPMKPNLIVWGALLGACRVHKNVDMAEMAAMQLLQLEPDNGAVYVLLCNIYTACNRWESLCKVRKMIMDRGIKKTPGCSLIETNGTVHEFVAGEESHPQSAEIYSKLEEMMEDLKIFGYVPDTSELSQDVGEEKKESALSRHSEKLAMAFGLISSERGATIRIVKNLRICGDCHHVAKLVSRMYSREVIIRDKTRFHHFKNGSCSCKDYW
ncbi:hypothetical protein NMG60_11004882 [Bertholletia excelsa]